MLPFSCEINYKKIFLSRNNENFVEQLKHRYGVILFKMLYHDILAILWISNLEQLKRKNNTLRIL